MISLNWLDIQAKSLPERNIIALTHVGAILILACSPFYHQRFYWTNGTDEITDSDWDEIERAIGRMEHEVMSGLIGAILPHVMSDITSLTMLACDGTIYNRIDYPLLYDAIDPIFIIDADTFSVPDLRDKFPVSEGLDFSLNDTGGTFEETLSEAQMPSHSHESLPHTHSEIIAVPSVAGVGVDVPVPSAIVGAGITGLATVDILPSGSNEPHNNLPPFIAVRWAIVAG